MFTTVLPVSIFLYLFWDGFAHFVCKKLSKYFFGHTKIIKLLENLFLCPTSYFLLPTSHFPLLTFYFLLPSNYSSLPTSYFIFLTSNFQLLTFHFVIPNSYYTFFILQCFSPAILGGEETQC